MGDMPVYYPNKEDYQDHFWHFNFKIEIDGIVFYVNAGDTQDAVDYLIDYCEEHLPGLLLTRKEEEEEEYLQECVCGGNHGRFIASRNIQINKWRV